MFRENGPPSGAGELTESLQLQAIALSVKALIATHPNPENLEKAMRDLFAQFQSTAVFLRLSEPQRQWARDMFSNFLPALPSIKP
jgi:hypothetical protein